MQKNSKNNENKRIHLKAGYYPSGGSSCGIVVNSKNYFIGLDDSFMITSTLKPNSEIYSLNIQTIRSSTVSDEKVTFARVITEYKSDISFYKSFELSNGVENSLINTTDGIMFNFGSTSDNNLFWRLNLQTSERYETPLIRKLAIEYWE